MVLVQREQYKRVAHELQITFSGLFQEFKARQSKCNYMQFFIVHVFKHHSRTISLFYCADSSTTQYSETLRETKTNRKRALSSEQEDTVYEDQVNRGELANYYSERDIIPKQEYKGHFTLNIKCLLGSTKYRSVLTYMNWYFAVE